MGEMATKTVDMAFCVLAKAFGIPFGLQGKPLVIVQLASLAFLYNLKALCPRHWPSTAEA
jgi:hypothetical protein